MDTLLAKEKSNLEKIISDIENITANLRDNNDEISTISGILQFSPILLASADIPQTLERLRRPLKS